jgi:transcriptional regulator with XRE-family HTH domain
MNVTRKLLEKLRRKAYREAYVEENVRTGIAYQIRALREARGWSQKKFAEMLGKPQSVLSRIEDPDYGKLSLQTLLEVASTFDVALLVQFADFPDFIGRMSNVSPEALNKQSFNEARFAVPETITDGLIVMGISVQVGGTLSTVQVIQGAHITSTAPVTMTYPTGSGSEVQPSAMTEWTSMSSQERPREGTLLH